MRSPTDERNVAITQAQLDYERAKRKRNGSSGEPEEDVSRRFAIVPSDVACDVEHCPAKSAPTVSQSQLDSIGERTGWRRLPVTLGLLVAIVVGAAGALVWAQGQSDRLERKRDKALLTHSVSETAHPGIRAAVRTAEQRLSRRIDKLEQASAARHQAVMQALQRRRR